MFEMDKIIVDAGILSVVQIENVEDAIPLAQALVSGGIRTAEITFRNPEKIKEIANVISCIKQNVPDLIVGGASVTSPDIAKIAVDSFHVMQNVNRAMNKIRCTIMAKYNEKTENLEDNNIYYYFLKKFEYFFTMEFDKIPTFPLKVQKLKATMYKSEIIKFLLSIDDKLTLAYKLTSKYREFNKTANYQNCSMELEELINLLLSSIIFTTVRLTSSLL